MSDRTRLHPRRDTLSEAEADRITEVLAEHGGYLEAMAVRHARGDQQEAQEIAGEARLLLCRTLNGLREPAALRSYIYRVVQTAAHVHFRSRVRELHKIGNYARCRQNDDGDDPERQLIADERREALHAAMAHLTPRQHAAIRDELSGDGVLQDDKASGSEERMARLRARRRLRDLLADNPLFQ